MLREIVEGKNDILDELEDLVKNNNFMSLKDPLKKAGFKVKVLGGDMPLPPIYYEVSKKNTTYTIINKKYAEGADRIVGEIAIG